MELSDLKENIKTFSTQDELDLLRVYAEDLLFAGDIYEIREFLDYFSELLNKFGKNIETKNPELYDRLQSYWVILAFKAFMGLESNDQINLLQTRLLYAIQKGFEPDRLIKDFYDTFELDDSIKEMFRSFSKALEQNTEQFGSAPIVFEGRKLMPALKYWIQDYAKTPSKTAKRGSIERLNYVNQSINARPLTQVYKQQLLKILKFYDDLNNSERPMVKAREPQSAVPVPRATAPRINIDQKLDELKQRVK